jgi:SAM-dependent methyltransferase
VFCADRDQPFALGPEADQRHALAGAWFAGGPGACLLAAEAAALEERLVDCFGYHLVQVGCLPGLAVLSASRVLQRCVIDIDGSGGSDGYPMLRGRAAALPIESDSVDVVVMPHVLEFEPRPHEALREAVRVLVPDGRLFVCAFNPWSLMGLWQLIRRRGPHPPWHGRFLAQGRLRDWLELLELELVGVDSFFFRPPVRSERVLQRLAGLERVGARAWPALGGAYLLSVRRRVSRATPVRPRFSYRPRLVGASLAGGPPARIAERG